MKCLLSLLQLVNQSKIPVTVNIDSSALFVEQKSIKINKIATPASRLKCTLGKIPSCLFTQGKNQPTKINPDYVHFSLLLDLFSGKAPEQKQEIKNSEYFKKDILPHEAKSFDQAIPNNQYCDQITIEGSRSDFKTWTKITFYNKKKEIGVYLVTKISCKN